MQKCPCYQWPYIAHHLEISYYVNFLAPLAKLCFEMKVTHKWLLQQHFWLFFAICIFIFHKTEVQTVILRFLTAPMQTFPFPFFLQSCKKISISFSLCTFVPENSTDLKQKIIQNLKWFFQLYSVFWSTFCYSCNNITTTLIQISHLFLFWLFL